MRPFVAVSMLTLTLVACAPPDPVVLVDSGVDTGVAATEPIVRILFPEVDGNGQVNLELADDCSIAQLFVFDVDNFELLPAAQDPDEEGKGHVHLTVGTNYLATDSTSVTFTATGVDASSDVVPEAGQFGVLTASLQENNHDDLNRSLFPDSVHSLEYVVTDPSGNCL